MFELLAARRFLPLFITQFFGAFNDNFLKCAILTLVTFTLAGSTANAAMLTNLAMALFILPYFLFSALAGQLTDRYDKAACCRVVKFVEIILMALTAGALLSTNVPLLLGLLFCMGAQSTFFGPAKYALLPQHLADRELVAGNALIEGGTFVAILIGSIAGSLLIALPGGSGFSAAVLLGLAIVGYLASRRIPKAPPAAPDLKIAFNLPRESWRLLRDCLALPVSGDCIWALSGFWMVGSLYVSQLPCLCRDVLGGDQYLNTFFLTLFSIGVAGGSLAAGRFLKGRISGRFASGAALGMALFTLDLALASGGGGSGGNIDFGSQFGRFRFWRIAGDLLGIALAGGVFSVPLQALMQHAAPRPEVARVIAANNIVNAFFMAVAALLTAAAAFLWQTPIGIVMLGIALICLANAIFCRRFRKS